MSPVTVQAASLSARLTANAGVRDNHRRQQVRHALQGRGHVSSQRCVHCRFSAERCVLYRQGKWRLQHVFTGCLSDERRLLQIRLLPRKRRLQRTVGREVQKRAPGAAAGSCTFPGLPGAPLGSSPQAGLPAPRALAAGKGLLAWLLACPCCSCCARPPLPSRPGGAHRCPLSAGGSAAGEAGRA